MERFYKLFNLEDGRIYQAWHFGRLRVGYYTREDGKYWEMWGFTMWFTN